MTERARRHRRFMATYYEIRDLWEAAAEAASAGYAAELVDFETANPRPTFRQYLTDTKGQTR